MPVTHVFLAFAKFDNHHHYIHHEYKRTTIYEKEHYDQITVDPLQTYLQEPTQFEGSNFQVPKHFEQIESRHCRPTADTQSKLSLVSFL